MYYKIIEKAYPFEMKKNNKNMWVYATNRIRNPKNMNQRQKVFLKKMIELNPENRISVDKLYLSLKFDLENNS